MQQQRRSKRKEADVGCIHQACRMLDTTITAYMILRISHIRTSVLCFGWLSGHRCAVHSATVMPPRNRILYGILKLQS